MLPRHYPPLALLLTGFGWLVLSSILGLAILVGLVRGTPLPPWVRSVHVHAALVGGVPQMILGGFLAFLPSRPVSGRNRPDSHPILFLTINAGTIGMLVGFWLLQHRVVGAAGLLVACAFLWTAREAWMRARQGGPSAPSNLWYYALALVALFVGLGCGEMMALALVQQSYGYVRLAHIHLILLGFITLTIVVVIHTLLPEALRAPASDPQQSRLALVLMVLGVAILIGGFMNSLVPVEMAAGAVLFAGGTLYAGDLFRAWMSSTHRGSAASDHMLIGTFFLLLTIVVGVLVGINSLSNPPVMPYGTLHLVAYTHLAFVGFVLQTIMGALSHVIPVALAASRVPNNKKRGPYLDQLTAIIDRWRPVQVGGVSLGTMGLAVLAALTWNVPLSSLYIQVAMWSSFALLLGSLVFFCSKLAYLFATQPPQ